MMKTKTAKRTSKARTNGKAKTNGATKKRTKLETFEVPLIPFQPKMLTPKRAAGASDLRGGVLAGAVSGAVVVRRPLCQ